jgi:3-oxoacyl-[acyl-carrier protein] reductase
VSGRWIPRLTGRITVLTGAGGSLGLQTAQALLGQGAVVVANHRSPSHGLDKLREEYPDTLHPLQGDIGDEACVVALVSQAKALGRLDVVVHGAAVTRDRALVRMEVEDWDEVMRVNLRGAFLLTKHAVRQMMRQRYGRFVYVSSLSGVIGLSGQANYAASKAGLQGLSHSVAQEYGHYGIRTVVLAPGFLDSGMVAAVPEQIRRTKAERTLLGVGTTTGVAETIAYLASPEADFINATVIRIDGGISY